jgi:DNA-binding CsgD family transcriptional regulator
VRIGTYFIIFFICLFQQLAAQTLELNSKKLAAELSSQNPEKQELLYLIRQRLEQMDSTSAFEFLDALALAGKSEGYHFQARINCLRAMLIYLSNIDHLHKQNRKQARVDQVKKRSNALLSSAMAMAYLSEDDYLIAYVSTQYASISSQLGDIGTGVMYAKNSIDLYEQLSYTVPPYDYQFLAEILYKVREYEECAHYGIKAVNAWKSSPKADLSNTVSSLNTVALAYHRRKMIDSALIFYKEALQLAQQTNNSVWVGIVSGNIGQILYSQGAYDSAYVLLKADYASSMAAGYYDNAANSLQWAARVNLAKGNKAAALAEVREAFQLLKLWPVAGYLRNTYLTTSQIFRKMEVYDSAFHYNSLYANLHDSLEKVVATSSLAISQAKLDNEQSHYHFQSLNKERKAELFLRNLLIAAVIICSLVALQLLNSRRLKEQLKIRQAEQEKLRMEQEVILAKERMRVFTESNVEKTNLIAKLERQANDKEAALEQQAIIAVLIQHVILTEDDWNHFKRLFEQAYPQFFTRLKNKFPDMTLAEQRLAALIRLHLTTRQMASLLGISPDSVHKSRQRLRQRLHVGRASNLEEIVSTI